MARALPGSGRSPNATQLEFLRACLLEGEPGRLAFERWLEAVGNPIDALRDPSCADRNLFALLQEARARDTAAAAAPFPSVLRAAQAHEELRANAIGEAAGEVLERLSSAGIEPLVTGGIALAWGTYERPSLRHCGNVDLLVTPELLEPGRAALGDTEPLAGPGPVRLVHPSGTRIALHTQLFGEGRRRTSEAPGRHAVGLTVAGRPARAVSGADLLVQLCTAAGGLRTVADAYTLCSRGKVDWARVRDRAVLARKAGPLYELLGLLEAELGLVIPEQASVALVRSRQREQARELLVRGPRRARNGLRRVLRQARV